MKRKVATKFTFLKLFIKSFPSSRPQTHKFKTQQKTKRKNIILDENELIQSDQLWAVK